MNKRLLVSGLILISSAAWADDVGKVLSSTAITRDVRVEQKQCAPDANPRDACRSVATIEKRTTGYKVVYEYAGKQYTTELKDDPGATVSIQISPLASTRAPASPAATPLAATTLPRYEERWDADRDQPYRTRSSNEGWDADRDAGNRETIVVEPRYVERVYVTPSYYPLSSYYYPSYYPSYYAASYLPVLGLSIGLSRGFRGGYGYYGHRGHGR